MNNCSISGKVLFQPKTGRTLTNFDFVKFIVEVERPKGKDGKQSFDRINVGCWGSICKYAQYVEQGDQVEFTGPLTTTSYQKDGQWFNGWEVSAKTLKILSKEFPGQESVHNIETAPIPTPTTPPPMIELPPMQNDDVDPLLPFDICGGSYL